MGTPSSNLGISKTKLMNDSLVALPKTVVMWMAKDVVRARYYEQEINALTGLVSTKEGIIEKQDTIILAYRNKLSSYSNLLGSCQDLNDGYELEIVGLKKQLKKQTNRKKFWRTAAFILPVVVGTAVHLDWKYGK